MQGYINLPKVKVKTDQIKKNKHSQILQIKHDHNEKWKNWNWRIHIFIFIYGFQPFLQLFSATTESTCSILPILFPTLTKSLFGGPLIPGHDIGAECVNHNTFRPEVISMIKELSSPFKCERKIFLLCESNLGFSKGSESQSLNHYTFSGRKQGTYIEKLLRSTNRLWPNNLTETDGL